jgi:prepilin-type N-terminal cleavage/methylation domain-containing protein
MLFSRLAPLFLLLKVCLVVFVSVGAALVHSVRRRMPKRTLKVRRPRRHRAVRHRPLRRLRHQHGFTLIEIGVVLLVAAMLMGVAVPAISNVSGMQAKGEINKLAANIRATRGHAGVSGQTCRLAVEIDASSYSVECTKGLAKVATESSRNGERVVEKQDKSERSLTESEKKERQILRRTQFAATPTVPPQTLKGGLSIVSVSTPHQTEKYTKGTAYVYFFPSGTSEQANIVLQRGDDFYTVQVAPFAGRVKILPKKVEALDDDDES